MKIPPALGTFLVVNNYLHNFATVLLVASGAALWLTMRKYDSHLRRDDKAVAEHFLGRYRGMTKVAKLSLFWILAGGVPRILFYRDFEWAGAVKNGHVPALIVKQVLAFAFVGAGVYIWVRLRKKVREIEEIVTPRQA